MRGLIFQFSIQLYYVFEFIVTIDVAVYNFEAHVSMYKLGACCNESKWNLDIYFGKNMCFLALFIYCPYLNLSNCRI
jgi:hypothetical protein